MTGVSLSLKDFVSDRSAVNGSHHCHDGSNNYDAFLYTIFLSNLLSFLDRHGRSFAVFPFHVFCTKWPVKIYSRTSVKFRNDI